MLSGMSLSEQKSMQDLPLKLCERCLWGWLCRVGFLGNLSRAVSQKRPLTGLLTDSANGFITETPPLQEWGRCRASLFSCGAVLDQPKSTTL